MMPSRDRIGSVVEEARRMGCFYGSVQVRGEDREAVRAVLEGLARKNRTRCWLGPSLGGWIGVYPQLYGQDSSLARDLARRLPQEIFRLTVYDDDVFEYDYYRGGKRIDQYSSRPDYHGVLSQRARKALRGRPATFAHLAIDSEQFARLGDRIAEQQTQPAVFASELLTLLASALGIGNVQTCYEYLEGGESDVDRWDDFVHIPDLSTEQARNSKADAALQNESRRVLREGLLLAEHGGQRGRNVPSPHWCPSPDGSGFLVAWAAPDYTPEPVPVERVGPPWSAGPVPTGLAAGWDVMQLVLSQSGRHLAMVCSNSDARVTAWRLDDRRCLARLPRGHAAFRAEFLADESAVLFVGASVASEEIGILPLGSGEPRFIAFARPKLAAVHPEGEKLAVLDGRDRLSVLDLPSNRVGRSLFFSGIRPPINTVFLLGPKYPRDWYTMAPEALEDLLRQKQSELLKAHEQPIQSQPIDSGDSPGKLSPKQIEMFARQAREALATTRTPGWRDEKARSGEFISEVMFDPSGARLFTATLEGVRVYLWREILEASDEMPPPVLAVNLDSWLKETPEGTEPRNSFVATLAYDPDRNWLLFAGQEGRVRYLDLLDGRTGVLLEPPGRPAIGRLALSRDRSALGITCNSDINDEGRNKRAAVIQFWDYAALRRAL
jgi:hypothetical protein